MSHIEWETIEIGGFKKLDMPHPFPPRYVENLPSSAWTPAPRVDESLPLLRLAQNATADVGTKAKLNADLESLYRCRGQADCGNA